ncbi:Uncharacterized membrane protein YfcA [Selenomonas ruminantium]|uniref:Probable membrane transporter protein n=1 Tax=Selenomonas ruminantium TaxID=971 RepID=A0A1I3DEE0_SELRU|nr:sulfite exporter TauE/SafE family protein [Selenomonas ruminantium]SFH84959.1 Uncharacterized membrane protein YfcA [Selenomonas ruminantium]
METYLINLSLHIAPLFCVFLAAFLQSITGFGLVIVAAPLLMFFYDPKLVIPIMILLATCGNIAQTILLHRECQWKVIGWLLLGAVIGQPLGYQIYAGIPAHYLKILISCVVLVSLAIMQLRQQQIRICPRNTIRTGIAAGIMAMTTGMAGPPVAMYLASTALSARELRATSIGFFFFSNLVSLATFALGGVSLTPCLYEFIYLLPGLACGILLGQLTFRFFPVHIIKRIIFTLLYFTCFYTIYRVLITM